MSNRQSTGYMDAPTNLIELVELLSAQLAAIPEAHRATATVGFYLHEMADSPRLSVSWAPAP